MKTMSAAGAAVILGIALSACSDGEPTVTEISAGSATWPEAPETGEGTEPEPDPEPAPVPTPEPEPEPEPESEPEPETATDGTPTTEASPGPTEPAPELNSRGNLALEIGEAATIVGESGDVMAEFTLTEIQQGIECTLDYADEPGNGEFVGLYFEVEIMEAAAAEQYFYFDISAYDMRILDADGRRENDSVGNSYLCLDVSEELPWDLGPGESAEGWVVLDTSVESGSIIYSPYYDYDFEWSF